MPVKVKNQVSSNHHLTERYKKMRRQVSFKREADKVVRRKTRRININNEIISIN